MTRPINSWDALIDKVVTGLFQREPADMNGCHRLFTAWRGSAMVFCTAVPLLVASFLFGEAACCYATEPEFAIEQQSDRLVITCGGEPVATYVFSDKVIPRPYFTHVHAPGGRQVTRNHPPVEGRDRTDHAELHPGIWLTFGDLSGGDFWRNKDRIVHEAFVEAPTARGSRASFAVRNRYERSDGTPVCQEVCKLTFNHTPFGYMLLWDSLFSGDREFSFGDQEEMGLGIRVCTPISVQRGGTMLDSEGRQNEKEIWGKTADWCDYSGRVGWPNDRHHRDVPSKELSPLLDARA